MKREKNTTKMMIMKLQFQKMISLMTTQTLTSIKRTIVRTINNNEKQIKKPLAMKQGEEDEVQEEDIEEIEVEVIEDEDLGVIGVIEGEEDIMMNPS